MKFSNMVYNSPLYRITMPLRNRGCRITQWSLPFNQYNMSGAKQPKPQNMIATAAPPQDTSRLPQLPDKPFIM